MECKLFVVDIMVYLFFIIDKVLKKIVIVKFLSVKTNFKKQEEKINNFKISMWTITENFIFSSSLSLERETYIVAIIKYTLL